MLDFVVLAAGLGTRLRGTGGRPKPLLELGGGLTLVGLVLDVLRHAGARRVHVVVAPETARHVEEEGWRLGLDVVTVVNPCWWRENGFSLALALSSVESDKVLVTMSDHVLHPSIVTHVIGAAAASDAAALVGGDAYAYYVDREEATRIEVAAGGKVVRIGKGVRPYHYVDVGVLAFSRSHVEAVLADAGAQLRLSDVVMLLASTSTVRVVEVSGLPWTDVDSDTDYYELLAGRTRAVLEEVLRELRR